MKEQCSAHVRPAGDRSPRHRGTCDTLLVSLVLLTLVRTGEALAGEQAAIAGDALKPDFDASRRGGAPPATMVVIPDSYRLVDQPSGGTFSANDFRPRGHSVFDGEFRTDTADNAPLIGSPTVWQRLAEYRSRDRVQLLTLWETGSSSVSLQAGKKGSPSLQWTSRLMNHGGATRGLLDRFFATSLADAGRGLHLSPHTAPEPASKPAKLMDAGTGGLK